MNNGGLGNNARREQLLSLFEPFGRVTNLVMEPDQPYAFVSYSDTTEASAALAALHGQPVEELQTVPSTPAVTLYLSYVDKGMNRALEDVCALCKRACYDIMYTEHEVFILFIAKSVVKP